MRELVYLEWCDAMINNEAWLTNEEVMDWADNDNWIVSQVGWILKETEEYIILASKSSKENKDSQELFGSVFKLPTTWIRKRIAIKL